MDEKTFAQETGIYVPGDAVSANLDKLFADPAPEPVQPAPPAPPAEEPKPPTEPPKPAADPKPATPPEDDDGIGRFTKKPEAPKVEKPKDLLEAELERLKVPKDAKIPKNLLAALRQRLETEDLTVKERDTLKAEIAEIKKNGVPADVQAKWKQEREQLEKERAELQETVRLTRFEKSDEFRNDYVTPLENAWESAFESFSGQDVIINGETRKTTPEDFTAVVSQNGPIPTRRKAAELFGEDAPSVLIEVQKIRELTGKRDQALETWRAKGAEFEAKTKAQQQELQQRSAAIFNATQTALTDKYKDVMTPKDGNDDEKAAWEVSMALNQRVFGKKPQTPEEWERFAKDSAAVAARNAAFGPLLVRNIALQAALAEAEKKLKAFDRSEPKTGGETGTPAGGAKKAIKSSADRFDEYFADK